MRYCYRWMRAPLSNNTIFTVVMECEAPPTLDELKTLRSYIDMTIGYFEADARTALAPEEGRTNPTEDQ